MEGNSTDMMGTKVPASRLTRLDGLRGLAACGVAFLYHPLLKVAPDIMDGASALPLWFRAWGWTFVDLFFLISGYIFAHVYLRGPGLARAALGEFAVARIARLYPLHLLTLLICVAVFWGAPGNTWYVFLAHLVMAQAFVGDVAHTFNGPSWSISVEVVCYILFALGASRGDRALRWVTAAAIGAALAHLILQGRPGGPWVGDGVPRGLLGFFLGQVLWRWRVALARVPAALLAASLLLGLALDMGTASSLLPICLLAWPSALLLAMRVPALGGRLLLWLGDRSYTIYLVHFPVFGVFTPWLASASHGWAVGAIMLLYMAVVLALSHLVYGRFEVPARRALRAAWTRRSVTIDGPAVRPA